jgi:galactokinase
LDCHDGTHAEVPLPPEVAVIVADTGVKHSLASGAYAARRASCERILAAVNARGLVRPSLRHCTHDELAGLSLSEEDARRGLHVVGECRRTQEFAAALAAGDLATCGVLMRDSHESLRTLYEVSCPELDALAEAARVLPGVHGARMTGGGFGGCIVALADAARAASVVDALASRGATQVFATPACNGAASVSLA